MRHQRMLVNQVMGKIYRANGVLRNADRMGQDAFEKWLIELRSGLVKAIEEIDVYFRDKKN